MAATHFEPYVHLVDVTPRAALIAWGGFYFRTSGDDEDWVLVDDEDLAVASATRSDTMGARSKPYGSAEVIVTDEQGEVVGRVSTSSVNHAWVGGLQPDSAYRYRIVVDGEGWAEEQLYDWVPRDGNGHGGLRKSDRSYDHCFRTHPALDTAAPLTFAVIGDYGWGIRTNDAAALRQRNTAEALEHVVDSHEVRVLLTAGDNIYLGPESTPDATGAEDDDWFFTFYQPYRYVLNRVPVYPVVGNHDAADEEASDDREQLSDNFHIAERFASERGTERPSLDPGLFYRFRFGRDIEFLAIDSSLATELDERRFFDHPKHVRFLEEALPDRSRTDDHVPRWIIPFSHHPPFCAGPHHENTHALIDRLLPLIERAGVRLMISGHEHNYQHSVVGDTHFFVTGAAAKLREGEPTGFADAHTESWAAEGHFLLVRLTGDGAVIHPVRGIDDGELVHVDARTPGGDAGAVPVVIEG